MRLRHTFGKTNNSFKAAKKFASCSCPANNMNNNVLFSDIAIFAVSVFLCIAIGFLSIFDIIGIIILNLIVLLNILLGNKFARKSQSA